MLPKKTLTLLIVVAIVILALGVWFGSWALSLRNSDPAGPSKYSAVYTATGDIYFGELHWFPRLRLTNVYFLQRSVGADNQTTFNVAPLRNAFWGPSGEISLNPEQIIFSTRLQNDSQVVKVFENPSLLNQQTPAGPANQGQSPAGDFKGPTGPPPSSR